MEESFSTGVAEEAMREIAGAGLQREEAMRETAGAEQRWEEAMREIAGAGL